MPKTCKDRQRLVTSSKSSRLPAQTNGLVRRDHSNIFIYDHFFGWSCLDSTGRPTRGNLSSVIYGSGQTTTRRYDTRLWYGRLQIFSQFFLSPPNRIDKTRTSARSDGDYWNGGCHRIPPRSTILNVPLPPRPVRNYCQWLWSIRGWWAFRAI